MRELRYSLEDAEAEAKKMQDLLRPGDTKKDYDLAEEIVERAKDDTGYENWYQALEKGYLTIMHPRVDKSHMIALQTKDAETRCIFDLAAQRVLRERNRLEEPKEKLWGFNQHSEGDLSAWELYRSDDCKVSPRQVAQEIYAEMNRIKNDPRSYEYVKNFMIPRRLNKG